MVHGVLDENATAARVNVAREARAPADAAAARLRPAGWRSSFGYGPGQQAGSLTLTSATLGKKGHQPWPSDPTNPMIGGSLRSSNHFSGTKGRAPIRGKP